MGVFAKAKKTMTSFLKRFSLAFIIFVVVILLYFSPVFLKGQVPFPGDLLLAQYQPWRSSSYAGFAPGAIPNKAQYFDTLRQLYPWKTFAIKEIKRGSFPLWNPHNFSGSPLFANFQSAILFPFNIFYLLFSQINAWTILVILQPFLAMVSVYFLAKKYGLSQIAAIFSATSYAFCLYMTTFLEYNIMGHFMYLVPFAMLAVEWAIAKKTWAFPLLACIIGVSGFAGHAQLFMGTAFYILFYSFVRIGYVYSMWRLRLIFWLQIAFFVLAGVGISGIQLLPGIELISQSARSAHNPEYFLNNLLIRPSQIILYMIPDLFGNPATGNYLLSFSYPSKAVYIGLTAFYLAIMSFFMRPKNKNWKTVAITTIAVALVVFLNPVSIVIYKLQLPLFSTSSPSNFIFLVSLGLCLLAGFGFDELRLGFARKSSAILFCFWLVIGIVFLGANLLHIQIVRNNLIYSLLVLSAITVILGILKFTKKRVVYVLSILIVVSCLDLFYFFHKFNSFVPVSYVYPPTPVGTWLSKNTGINRFWGYSYAGIEANFSTQLRLYSPDGYDPLYPKQYGQLIQTSGNGEIPLKFNDQTRSDAVIASGFGKTNMTENHYRLKLLSLLGTKFVLDKAENGSSEVTFPASTFEKAATIDDFNVFINKKAAPRFFLTNSFRLYNTKEDFTKKLFDKSFQPEKTILLSEKPPSLLPAVLGKRDAILLTYNPNSVSIKTVTDASSLLYLSDTYYPGWKAFVDAIPVKIYRANYIFRAIEVPAGVHEVIFRYEPKSVLYGLYLTIISIIVTIFAWGFLRVLRKKARSFS